jgi:hypothetical protein
VAGNGGLSNGGFTNPTVAGYNFSHYVYNGAGGGGTDIEKTLFSNDSIASLSTTLLVNVFAPAGFSSSMNGYAAGGAYTTQVQRLSFSSEAISTLASTMTGSNGYSCAGFENRS